MSVLSGILIGLATGIVFGFALEKSRVFEPGIIVGQMQLRSFLMLKVFLAAVITGLIALAVLNGVFGVKLSLKPLLLKADIIGGLILGVGIAISGACPGTSLAQVGAGYRDALFIVAGGLAGALVYGYNDAAITAFFAESGAKVSFNQWLGLPFWVGALGLAAVLAVGVMILEKLTPWRSEIGTDHDGVIDNPDSAANVINSAPRQAT